MNTVADQFAETLAIANVKRIDGIVTDSLNGLTDTIRHQGKIEWLHVRHDEVGAFAAHIPSAETGANYVQAIHPQTPFKECSHCCEFVPGPT
jgi:pyruvate dehydrogenase (quinone)